MAASDVLVDKCSASLRPTRIDAIRSSDQSQDDILVELYGFALGVWLVPVR